MSRCAGTLPDYLIMISRSLRASPSDIPSLLGAAGIKKPCTDGRMNQGARAFCLSIAPSSAKCVSDGHATASEFRSGKAAQRVVVVLR